ncbi:ABC transporter substrate-binding protein [Streptomyces sp. TP-A0874]|uniref:ABC transporter substrate-binding protein n=1 Tax=Streptomyces sp. TP-A0874 TaxID=549819 RepID=UPI000853ACC2|nr:ABC transporter substrate-binding protein [Streptomyces sp. TP-A0874]
MAVSLLAACGSSQGAEPASPDDPVKVKVGVVPAAPAAAIYLGEEKGFFTDAGVDLKTSPAQTGAAVVASLLNGELDSGYISSVVAVQAMVKGVPIQFAAGGDSVPTDPSRRMYGGVVVREDSPVRAPEDLAGRTVAVNALQGVDHLAALAMVDKAGGDSAKVKFVEVPYPEQASALRAGRVDAVAGTDPFYSQALKQGGRSVGKLLEALGPGALVSGYVVTKQYAAKHQEEVKRFAEGMSQSSSHAMDHDGQVRKAIQAHTEIPADIVAGMNLPTFEPKLDTEAVQTVIDLMVTYKFIDEPIDAQQAVAGAGR